MTSAIQAIIDSTAGIKNTVTRYETEVAMLTTASLESGLNPSDVGDSGTSFGLFQAHNGRWGITQADLGNATKQAQAAEPDYYSAVTQASQSSLLNGGATGYEQIGYKVERPAQTYYASQGTKRVNQAFKAAQDALTGKLPPGSAGTSTTTTTTTPTSGSGSSSGGISPSGVASSITAGFISIALMLVGAVLIVMGIKALGGASSVEPQNNSQDEDQGKGKDVAS